MTDSADRAWQDVLDAQTGSPVRPDAELHGSALDAEQVTVTLAVSTGAAAPVEFGDNLYGATAWAPDAGGGWHRVDTAQMRLMIAPIMQPGEAVEITLPLDGPHDRVRVLLGTAWTELRR